MWYSRYQVWWHVWDVGDKFGRFGHSHPQSLNITFNNLKSPASLKSFHSTIYTKIETSEKKCFANLIWGRQNICQFLDVGYKRPLSPTSEYCHEYEVTRINEFKSRTAKVFQEEFINSSFRSCYLHDLLIFPNYTNRKLLEVCLMLHNLLSLYQIHRPIFLSRSDSSHCIPYLKS